MIYLNLLFPHYSEVPAAPRGDNRIWESGLRLDWPEFKGSLKPGKLFDCISTMEEF